MKFRRTATSALACTAILYSLIVLWWVPTQPLIPLGCMLTNENGTAGSGLEIRDTSLLENLAAQNLKVRGVTPDVGDIIISAAGRPIRNFGDWSRLHNDLRDWKIDSAATLSLGKDPTEDTSLSNLAVFEYQDHSRVVLIWFLRPGYDQPFQSCLPLINQPVSTVSLTLVWFVLQICVVVVGWVAYWNRPFDQPLQVFCSLSALTLAAFVGGSHWWIIVGSPILTVGFAIAGALMPAALLHFLMVYPFPIPFTSQRLNWAIRLVYFPPILLSVGMSVLILLVSMSTIDRGVGPFSRTLERLSGEIPAILLPIIRTMVHVVFIMSVTYFVLALLALRRSLQVARNPFERNQIKSLLWAASVAAALIGYTMYLAINDQVGLAFGTARLPMFGASLAFMLAYAIGIARYKLLLIDQVVSRGAWYYFTSAGLGIIFSSLIAVGAMQLLHHQLSNYRSTFPLILVLMMAVLILSLGRDSIQKILDRRFFSEKYQLDKALNRMNRVVASVMEPQAVAENLLVSCREVLHAEHAALYMRKENLHEYRVFSCVGSGELPLNLSMEDTVLNSLSEELVIQRIQHTSSPAQTVLRELQAEVVYGLEVQGHLDGLLILGPKENHQLYSAEDLAFIGAMSRIAGVAIYCATVQQDVNRLNHDLQRKMEKIDEQERRLSVLQNELATLTVMPSPATVVETDFRRESIKGNSPAILEILNTVKKVAGSDSSVLVRGESGTGKELLAKSIHDNSPRRTGPLITVHCAALSPTLLESELFGHVKGAFTDAKQDKQGRFQLAHGGTLFLDEIGEISLETQVKLLRVLQERVIEPVGGTDPIPVDVRIIAATHRNLEGLIETGEFREDLFYRLNVISITLPSLRDRQEDIYELALHFLRRSAAKTGKNIHYIDDEAMKCLHNYHWQGNIRELENVIERAVVLAESDSIRVEDLPESILAAAPWESGTSPQARQAKPIVPKRLSSQVPAYAGRLSAEEDRRLIVDALNQCRGNKAEAARLLGMPRSTFFSKMKKYGMT